MYTLNKHSRTARDFDTWRQNHRTRFKHIHLPLWEQVIALSQVFLHCCILPFLASM
jgi:hypothetical protein